MSKRVPQFRHDFMVATSHSRQNSRHITGISRYLAPLATIIDSWHRMTRTQARQDSRQRRGQWDGIPRACNNAGHTSVFLSTRRTRTGKTKVPPWRTRPFWILLTCHLQVQRLMCKVLWEPWQPFATRHGDDCMAIANGRHSSRSPHSKVSILCMDTAGS